MYSVDNSSNKSIKIRAMFIDIGERLFEYISLESNLWIENNGDADKYAQKYQRLSIPMNSPTWFLDRI